ncbi:MAG: hypothetical protein QXF88_00215 [Candidatus Aenigmatarchaeota archaeon]
MFGLFKKKKEDLDYTLPPVENQPVEETQTPEIEEQLPQIEEMPKVEEKVETQKTDISSIESELASLETLMPKSESEPSKNMTLENLCIKIDLEAEDIERRIKEIKTIVSKISLSSSEIFDLLDLYSKAKTKLKEFTQEIDRFDSIGWGVDEETAAFYKFKACKSLAKIRKEMIDIEELIKESGFTPAKIEEILHTPAEKLVDQMAKVKPAEHKLKKVKKKR